MAPTLAAQALLGPAWGQRPVGPPPPGLTTLRGLAAQLDKLLIAVDGADAAPSPDAETGFVAIQPAVEASLAAWEKIRP